MGEFENILNNAKKELAYIVENNIDINAKSSLNSFEEARNSAIVGSIKKAGERLSKKLWEDSGLIEESDENQKKFQHMLNLAAEFNQKVRDGHMDHAMEILNELGEIKVKKTSRIKFKTNILFPDEIKAFMQEDLNELERTFNAQCYRSSIIICGRLLETALHRKYFEKTGTDILEKHPEIGLGKIIAKLEEINIVMPPGLTQQIHMINQARIHSVHKKKEVFLPSKEQAYATILFTVDVLRKLF